MAEDELAAFDAIAGNVNDTKRKVLLGKYTFKIKAYVANKMKLESEKLMKGTEKAKENLENVHKRFNQNNLKSSQKGAATMLSSKCEMKKHLLLMRLRKEKLQKNTEDLKKKYTQKWSDYEKEYESTPLALERYALETEKKLKTFLFEKAKYEILDCNQAFKTWLAINKSREHHAIVNLANYMLSLPHKLRIISEKQILIHEHLRVINDLTKKRRLLKAQLEDMKLSRTLQMIQSSTFIPKRLAMQMNVIDDLPNMRNFSDTEIPKLEMPKLSQPSHYTVKVTNQSKMNKEITITNSSPSYDNNNKQDQIEKLSLAYSLDHLFDTTYVSKSSDNFKQQHKEQDLINMDDQEKYEVPQYPVIINSFSINSDNNNDISMSVETEPIGTVQGDEESKVSPKTDGSKKITILENRLLSQGTSSTMIYNTLQNANLQEVKNISLNDNKEIVIHPSCQDTNSLGVEEAEQGRKEELGVESPYHKSGVDINASSDIALPPTQYKDMQFETNTEVPSTMEPLTHDKTLGSELPSTTPYGETNTNTGHNDSFSPLSGPGVDPSFNISGGSQLNISCASVVSTESYKMLKEKLLQKYQLNKSPNFVYAKHTKVMPKFGNEQHSKYFSKIDHEDLSVPLNVLTENKEMDVKNKVPTSTDEPTCHQPHETDTKQAQNTKEVQKELLEIRKPVEPLRTLMFGLSGGIPPSLNMSYGTQITEQDDDSANDFEKLLETPAHLLLSPTYEEPETDTQEAAKGPTQSSSSFLFGLGHMKKTAFGMFGNNPSYSGGQDRPVGPDTPNSGNNKPQQDDFSFNFGASPETKRKKSGFFSLFEN